MSRRFTTQLAPPKGWSQGATDVGPVDPNRESLKVMGDKLSGAWLCCYMIRRFGWPNVGSDDYKDLCAWMITTPIDGLYLSVHPHMGRGSFNFALRCSKSVWQELNRDPELDKRRERFDQSIRTWWKEFGAKKYMLGVGDEDEPGLIDEWAKVDGKIHGIWNRPEKQRAQVLSLRMNPMVMYCLSEFVRKNHPDALPSNYQDPVPKSRPTAFQREAIEAIRSTLKDLMRPAYQRDVSFSPLGNNEEDHVGECVDHFPGAGYSPEYWFSSRRKKEIDDQGKPKVATPKNAKKEGHRS